MTSRSLTPPPVRESEAAVVAESLGFAYPGGRVALRGVDLEIAAGRITRLTGDSGSGKTTLLRALCGLIPHFHGGRMEGRVLLGGQDTRTARPEALGRRAGMLFQDPERQAVHRSVLRDVAFGPGNAGMAPELIRPAVDAALEEVGAGHLRDRALDELSGGERQRVALAGVIACGQDLVLLDEPGSQIDEAGRNALAGILDRLRNDGRAIVISEHGAGIRGVADATVHMRGGTRDSPPDAPEPEAVEFPAPGGATLLAVTGLRVCRGPRVVVDDVDLGLAHGEVRALTGPNGSGKTTLLMALAGLLPPESGVIQLDGRTVSGGPLSSRFPATALVPQDPRLYFLTEQVSDEIAFSGRTRGEIHPAEALERFDLAGLGPGHPLDLSSGQRQRVALAAAWAQEPDLLLLDEPTRGLDGPRRALLIAALAEHARRGGAALVATHDPKLITALPGAPIRLGGGA